MFLVRVQLPDRPGSLGQVATAIGTVGGDIEAIEIVERGPGYAINHFMVELATGMPTDALVSACAELPDVTVLWVSRYPSSWGIESDIETLERMSAEPDRAREILTDAAPIMFHCQWAVLLSPTGQRVASSDLAPDLTPEQGKQLLVTEVSRAELPTDWIPGWGASAIAAAPLPDESVIVLGRSGGPWFLDSELNRLRHLAALATSQPPPPISAL